MSVPYTETLDTEWEARIEAEAQRIHETVAPSCGPLPRPGRNLILVDRHHAGLFRSLQMLFRDRLRYGVQTPVGYRWFDEGYWQFGVVPHGRALADQYLEINATKWPNALPPAGSRFITYDPEYPEHPITGVTLDWARAHADRWFAVCATVQQNQEGFARFAREVGAAYLYHIGNTRQQVEWSLDPIALIAAEAPLEGRGCYIGEEIDDRKTFRFRDPAETVDWQPGFVNCSSFRPERRITSCVNLLPLIPEAWAPFARLQELLPEYTFASHGHHCPDGLIQPVEELAAQMSRASWAYHDKVTGDGFGHVIHDWAAVGRPLIGHARYYAGQRAAPLWQHGKTCIDLDQVSIEEAADIVRSMPAHAHAEMCHNIRRVYETMVDWEGDARRVADLLR